MAEGLFKTLIAKKSENKEIEVASAGICALEGEPASKNAIIAAKDYDANLTEHRAKVLTKEMITSVEIVLTMTESHKHHIINKYPVAQDKVYNLMEYAYLDEANNLKKKLNVPDPYGLSIEAYNECAKEIFEALLKVYENIFD